MEVIISLPNKSLSFQKKVKIFYTTKRKKNWSLE